MSNPRIRMIGTNPSASGVGGAHKATEARVLFSEAVRPSPWRSASMIVQAEIMAGEEIAASPGGCIRIRTIKLSANRSAFGNFDVRGRSLTSAAS